MGRRSETAMDAIGVIPARYGSTRFEGKVLADLHGKPMIQHVWERARQAQRLDALIVATDDERIARAVRAFGGRVTLTAPGHATGTDRVTEVVNPLEVRVVVNIQADEPLVHPMMIDALVQCLLDDPTLQMATLKKRIEDESEWQSPHVVKVVTDRRDFALYFSRAPIPCRRAANDEEPAAVYKHIGLYAYTKDFLFTYTHLPPSALEAAERLEQLRVLEHGYRIKVLETTCVTVGVDTPDDLERARQALTASS